MSIDKIMAVLVLALAGCDSGREVAAPVTQESAIARVEAPAATGESAAALIGTPWQWAGSVTQEGHILVEGPERYTLLFQADGRAVIGFDCNRGGGSYEIAGDSIGFGPLMSTRMACAEDSRDGEFMRELDQVTHWSIENGELFLGMPENGGVMRFAAAAGQGSGEQ